MTHTHENIALVDAPKHWTRAISIDDGVLFWYNRPQDYYESEKIDAPGSWRFVCLSTEMTEEKARMIVERYEQPIGWRADGDESKLPVVTLYRNYLIEKPIPVTFLKATALESFRSFVEFLGLADKEPLAVLVK